MAYSVRPAHTHHSIGLLRGSRLSSPIPVAHIYQTHKSPLCISSVPYPYPFCSLSSPLASGSPFRYSTLGRAHEMNISHSNTLFCTP